MTKKSKNVYKFLINKPGYLKKSPFKLRALLEFKYTVSEILEGLKQAKIDHKLGIKVISPKQIKKAVKTKNLTIKVVKSKPLNSLQAEELIENIKPIKKTKTKRLFFDIETSYNIVKAWRIGYNLNISSDDLIHERSVICVCWKWEGESKVNSLSWNKGDDKQLLIDFVKILNSADEIFAHNGDRFDIRWLRTRCLYHGVDMLPKYNSIDTLKLAKKYFYLNSNKLDYIGSFTGVGKKMETGGLKLWDAIILDNDVKAMDKMIKYCKVDVIRLQQVYDKISPYIEPKSHIGVANGGDKCDCASCGSKNTRCNNTRVLTSGMIKKQMLCKDCGKTHMVSETVFNNRNKIKK